MCIRDRINFADSAIVTRRLLDGGFTVVEARELWGQLSGYCSTMVGLPQVLTQAVAVAMVPAVAAAYKLKNRAEIKENINLGLRISLSLIHILLSLSAGKRSESATAFQL